MQRRDPKHDKANPLEWQQAMFWKSHTEALQAQNALPDVDDFGNYKIAKFPSRNGSEAQPRVSRNKFKDIAWIE